MLPGFSDNTPPVWEIQHALNPPAVVFVEEESNGIRTPYIVTRDQAVPMPAGIFAKSPPTAKQMDDLVKAWPDRTFPIGSRMVTFAICGEINGFDPDGSAKHRQVLPFDVLANPTHTVMGRWHILGPKLSALSKGKVVIHVANNKKNSEKLTTDLRVYVNEVWVNEHAPKAKEQPNLTSFECEI